jgi:hypothetical protein
MVRGSDDGGVSCGLSEEEGLVPSRQGNAGFCKGELLGWALAGIGRFSVMC